MMDALKTQLTFLKVYLALLRRNKKKTEMNIN